MIRSLYASLRARLALLVLLALLPAFALVVYSIGIPSPVASTNVNETFTRNLVGLGLVSVLALIAAWLFGDLFVVRRVNALSTTAEQLRAGNLSARTGQSYGISELGALARQFDDMAEAFQQREAERIKSEAALREWADMFQSTPVGFVVESADGGFPELINPAFAQMHGYTIEELKRKSVQDLIAPEERANDAEQMRILLDKGHHVFETRHIRKDGTVFPVLVDATWVKDEQGRVLRIASVQDISQLRRAEVEEREQRALAEALHDTAAALNSTLDFDEVLNRVLDNVGRVVPHDAADLMLIESEVARPIGSRGYAERGVEAWLLAQRFQIAKFPRMHQVLETGSSILITDVQNDPDWVEFPETRWIRSLIQMPIRAKTRVIGFLDVISTTPNFFNATHLARLEAFADQVTISLENVRLLAESEQRANQFSALYELTRDLAAQRDLPGLLQILVDRAIALLSAPCGFIYLYNASRNDLELAIEKGFDVPIGTRLKIGEGMAGRVAQNRQPLRVDDYRTWDNRAAVFQGADYSAVLEVPMIFGGELVGVLGVSEIGATTRRYTEADTNLLTLFASQAASMVRNARLLVETERRASEFVALYQTTVDLSSQQDLPTLLQTIVERAVKLLSTTGGGIYLYDAAHADLVYTAATQKSTPVGTRLQLGEGMAGRVAQTRQPLIVDDYRNWPGRSPKFEKTPFTAVLDVPMLYRGELIGVLVVEEVGETTRKFTDEDTRLLSLFAAHAASAVRDARLLEETRTRAEQLSLLYDAGLALNSVLDPRVQLEFLFKIATKALNAEYAEFFRFDAALNRLSTEMSVGYEGEKTKEVASHLSFSVEDERGLVGWVAKHRLPLTLGDVRADPRWIVIDPEIRSGMWVPVQHENELRGVLSVFSVRLNAFTAQDERLLVLFANQAATAMENAHLFEMQRQHSAELEALRQASLRVTSTLDLTQVLDQIITQSLKLVSATDAHIFLYDGARLTFGAAVWADARQPKPFAEPREDGITHTVARTGVRIVVSDVKRDPQYHDHPRDEAIACLPLRIGDQVRGVMNIAFDRPHQFDDNELRVLELLADQATIALENARLFGETRRRAEQLDVLNRIGRAVSQTLDLDELLEIIHAEIKAVLTVEAFFIALYDAVTNELDFRIQVDEGIRETPMRVPLKAGLSERVIATKKPVLVRNRETETHIPAPQPILWGTMKRAVSWLGVPMLIGDQVVGVICVQAYTPNMYGEEEERLLVTIADQVAVAVQNARLFDETRRRLNDLEAVNTISIALRLAKTVDEMLPLLLDETLSVFNMTAGQIALHDSTTDEMHVVVARGWCIDTPEVAKANDGIAGLVFESGQPYATREFKQDAKTSELARSQIPEGWGGAIVPIRTGQEVTGVFVVSEHLPREITPNEVRLLTLIAEIAGNAIHRAMLHEQTEQRLQRLDALHMIDTAISASLDLRVTLNILLDQVLTQLRVDATDVLLLNPYTQALEYTAGRGFRANVIEHVRVRIGQEYAGRAAIERRVIFIPNLPAAGANVNYSELIASEAVVSYCAAPLISKGQVKGVLEIFHRSPLKPDAEWLDFVETLAEQTAIAVDNAALFDSLQRSNFDISLAYDATIEGWARSIDLREGGSHAQSQRVIEMTLRMARTLRMSDADLLHVRRGALLHDIGTLGIPDRILLKSSPLTREESQVMRGHPALAYQLLSPIAYLRPATDIPYCHHENWDGTGFPRGLKGEQIPLAARIFAVAEAWSELRTDRPGRAGLSFDATQQHIRDRSGTWFDPQVVETLFSLLEAEND